MKPLSTDALIIAPRQELIDTIISLRARVEQLEAQVQEVQFSLEWFKKQIFGTKSERFIPSSDLQVSLDLGVSVVPVEVKRERIPAHTRAKATIVKGHGRGPMPTHLPFEDSTIEPDHDVTGWLRIGEEITWEYEYEPKALFVRRYIRPKYILPGKEEAGVKIGTLPTRAVEKGCMGPGLMANITVDKYEHHVPLDRQRKKYEAEYQVTFSESLLCDAIRNVGFWIEPVYKVMAEDLRQATYLQADETSIKVLWAELKGKAHTGWYWGYNDPVKKIVVFDFQMTRGREGPNEFLRTFKGILQTDDYAGYVDVRAREDIAWAACMAHVRRKFHDCLAIDRARADSALQVINEWFEHERRAREGDWDCVARLEMRQSLIKPSMDQFHQWLKEQVRKGLPKNPVVGAISYALNQWNANGFVPFLTDGRVELSNNLDENNMRPVAVGRKNYLFKGSPQAAARGAMIYSLLATARLHGLKSWEYLRDLLTYLPLATASQVRDFTPYNWKSAKENYAAKQPSR
jgi:transposase